MLGNFARYNLWTAVFTVLEVMKLFIVLLYIVDIIRYIALCTTFDISPAVA